MFRILFRVCASLRFTFVLLALYAVLLAAATVIEKFFGTAAALTGVYHAPAFLLLQAALAANALCVSLRLRLFSRRRAAFLVTHAALALILLGALVTHFCSREGVMHIREGERSRAVALGGGAKPDTLLLPFAVELDDFVLTRYPGSDSPSSYESRVTVWQEGRRRPARIYMNNVLDVCGYRFFQSSYDADECGTILSVSHDVAGRRITYAGYLCLAAGLLLTFFSPSSRFGRLRRQITAMRRAEMGLCLLLAVLPASGQEAEGVPDYVGVVRSHVVPRAHVDRFAALPMQSVSGRMMPVSTFASEVLRKLHRREEVYGLDADRFLLGMLVMPDVWMHIPFIDVPGKQVAEAFGLPGDYCAYVHVFDSLGNYRLQGALEAAYRKDPAARTRFDKDLLKLDERVNIFHLLAMRRMLKIFPLPADGSHRWFAPGDDLSLFAGMDSMLVSRITDWYVQEAATAFTTGSWQRADSVLSMVETFQHVRSTPQVHIGRTRMQTEVFYNRAHLFRHCKRGYLLFGLLGLLFAFTAPERKTGFWRVAMPLCVAGALLCFVVHAAGMGMRWYLAGNAPWSNSYETMVYVGWVTALSGLCFARRDAVALSLGMLFAGIILFVSDLNWMDPQISPLVPVLKSPWLMFHVAVIVAAYGFFGLSCLLGLVNMVLFCAGRPEKRRNAALVDRIAELTVINEMSLWIGFALMTAGTFLGAVWANESWGRYWGWDPKETWALVTMVVYALVTHLHLLAPKRHAWLVNVASAAAFSTVLMTFLGVNYLLRGMHSYGANPNMGAVWLPLLVVALVFVPLAVVSYRKAGFMNPPVSK